jgi:hypothetical protein
MRERQKITTNTQNADSPAVAQRSHGTENSPRIQNESRAVETIASSQGLRADKVRSLLRLQRQFGNRFVQRVIAREVIRPKVEEEEKEPLQRMVAHDVILPKLEEEEEKKEGSETFADAGLQTRSVTPAPAAIQRRGIIFGAGEVRFNGCSAQDLADFAVIPEEGVTTFTPTNGLHETDGFWWRHHSPKTEWFKISDDCLVDITCTPTGFERTADCTLSTPHWTSETHGSVNPF